MSAKTVTIDHPHAEVIAAYYSGKTVQLRSKLEGTWLDWDCSAAPGFSENNQWRIKPEPLVKWIQVDSNGLASDGVWSHRPSDRVLLDGYRFVRMVEMPE
jgi:hypothetical protein